MESINTPEEFRRTSRPGSVTRAQLVAMLEENATREYRAILGSIIDRQCDSLADFAMAEHMRSVMTKKST